MILAMDKPKKSMTWKTAIKQEQESYERLMAEIEAGRVAEAEEQRLMHDTSITCGHRNNVQYITVAEFDFTLCPDCTRKIMLALGVASET